ncbi:MAG: DUF2892 domain-containing protein [Chloroflexi bacterium]|nr:MAG: DUF2892 domain-containing protein [Chloroflexota bacterium]MBL1196150.1 DUF2892 domain-containing protein [Chloroflexota bacterium]NOH13443.1 DUF2892 domain-containing protein [Chloroflexota bacterium]
MKLNMGQLDRGIRLAIVALIAVLYFAGQITGLAAIILGLVAVIFAATSFIGFCPIYALFGLSTRNSEEA